MNRKQIIKALIFQEIFLIFISFTWIYFKYGFIDFNSIPLSNIKINTNTLLLGIISGIILFLISTLIVFTYEPLRKNLETIKDILVNKLKFSDFIIIALLSGISEELFFRGLLQEQIGIIFSNLIFAALHIMNKEFIVYGLLTFLAGNILGNIYIYTNNLFIVIVAHTINNLIALFITKTFIKK